MDSLKVQRAHSTHCCEMTATGHLCGCGWLRYRRKARRTKYRYHSRVRKAEVTSPTGNNRHAKST